MIRRLIFAAALALAAFGAQATCTLTTFRAFPDAGGLPSFIPLPPTGCANARVLAASTAETETPLTGANRAVISANCSAYYLTVDGTTAAVPAADIADGSAPLLNPTQLHITGVATISVIAPTTCIVNFWYYK